MFLDIGAITKIVLKSVLAIRFKVWFTLPCDSLCDEFTVMSSLFGEKVNSSHVMSSPCDEFTVSLLNMVATAAKQSFLCSK